jgi:hypothetical protein
MEDLIWDAVPAQRKRKEEQFTTPVVTMSSLEKVGAGRKFTFNKAAQELLGIVGEDRVSFGFQASTKSIFIKRASGDAGFKLTKTCTLSDKRTYEFISKMLELNNDVENHFDLAASPIGQGVVGMTLMVTDNVVIEERAIVFETRDLGEVSDENPHAIKPHVESDEEYVNRVAKIEGEVMPEPEVAEVAEVEGSTEEDVW